MSKLSFTFLPLQATKAAGFSEASREELRVLIALIECGGDIDSEGALARLSGVSRARCVSAIAFWEEEGVIRRPDERTIPKEEKATVVEEFEDSLRLGELRRSDSKDVAKTLRDENLAFLIDECARIMNRPALSSEEIKEIEALYSGLALSAEYIISLAAHLRGVSERVSVTTLSRKADQLYRQGITTFEELDSYIGMQERENASDKEIRRALSIRGRALVPDELALFHKWTEDLGYSVEIIKAAHNKAVMATGGRSLAYMDTLLTAWHSAGCKTVDECLKNSEAFSVEYKQKNKPGRKAAVKEKPRYGDFDVEEAFERALQRSYSKRK